jgi:predicted amidohydrolase
MRVAAIQHDIVWEQPDKTCARLAPMIAQAAADGARVVALSEMYSTGFSMHSERIAEDVGGPSTAFLVDQAREHELWVCGSLPERSNEGALPANTLVLAAPDGSMHRYAKIHPFTYAREHEHYAAGTQHVTVDVEGVRTSLFVCYDLRFADEFWALAPATDLYVVVANWPAARRDHWRALLRARAIENQAYVVGVNRVGRGGSAPSARLEYVGDSVILDPLGEPLAEAAADESIIAADVDAARVAEVRSEFPFLTDRR